MFTDPVAQIIITNPESGKVWYFNAPEYPFVTGVSLAFEFARKAALQVTFDAPYDVAIEKLLGLDSPFTMGNNVRARIGYANQPTWWTEWFEGFLAAGGDGLTIDPNGMTGTITVQVISEGSGYTVSQEIVQVTDPYNMCVQCAQVLGLEFSPSIGAIDQMKVFLAATGAKATEAGWKPEAFAGMTAWEATNKICAMLNLKLWIGSRPGSPGGGVRILYIGTEEELSTGILSQLKEAGTAGGVGVRPTFRMRGVVDLNTSTFPCLSWAPEGAGFASWLPTNMPQTGKGVELVTVNNKTGLIETVNARAADRKVATAGAVATPGQADNKTTDANGKSIAGDAKKADGKEAVILSAPVPEGDAGKARAQLAAEAERDAGSPSQVGVITSLGLPWMVPSELCFLRGCGRIYDGPYLVDKATHKWGPGTYEMTLTCRRQGDGTAMKVGEKIQTPVGTMPEK
jgi:hypothetical protein